MEIVLSILAVFAITTVVVDSSGPFGIFDRLRRKSWLGALDCALCFSVYAGAVLAMFTADSLADWLIKTFAYSGGAIIIYKILEALDG